MENMSTEALLAALNNLTAPQLVELTKKVEAAWGVSATPQVTSQVHQQVETTTAVEQTEWTVTLVSVPADKKMATVKAVREYLGLGLLESKTLVEAVPKMLKDGMPKEEAEAMRAKFTELGSVVEMK